MRHSTGHSIVRTYFIGTYPPRECGIATFTSDLRQAVAAVDASRQTSVIALTHGAVPTVYPPEVVFEIQQDQLRDYRLAAEYINFSGADVVCLQHEFGIFGGAEGRYVIELLAHLQRPVVTTLHTVLSAPSPALHEALVQVAQLSAHLVVLNSKAIPLLRDVYGIPEEKVTLIPHGVPDVPFVDPNYYKDTFGVEGRLVLLTFGLLSRNKGIELMLAALPEVVRAHPEVIYIVLGATHPEVKRHDGEEYRLALQRQVRSLGLHNHVLFYDRYVAFDELCEFIGACDIYVTPYQAREQIVSGTLAYAVGMGKAVVSTPYLYAEELLADGRGRLVGFRDPRGLAATLNELIDNELARHQMRKRAYAYGRQMLWREVGARYVALFEQVLATHRSSTPTAYALAGPRSTELPAITLRHLWRLTDDTGIVQHATYGIPDRRYGYSTDDVARALVVVLMHYQQCKDDTAAALADRYMSFLHYAQLPDGRFHNFMDYTRRFRDEVGGEDTQGRALWGLGVAVADGVSRGMRALAREMFERALQGLTLTYPHAMAYAICGLHAFLRRYDGATLVRRQLTTLADHLVALFEQHRTPDWRWFAEEMTYGNAKLPQALLLAGQATGERRYSAVGLEALDFLLAVTFQHNQFDFIGNNGWYRRGGERAIFGQQAIEAGYTIEACATAYDLTGAPRYLEMERAALEWFLGRNRLGQPLYDLVTGACADGLDPQGVSLNQGAESVICCLLGLVTASRQRESHAVRTARSTVAA